MLAYAVALWSLAAGPARWFALLILLDVVVMSLPWRVPRATRSLPSILLETIAYQVAPIAAVAVALTHHRDWFTAVPPAAWLVAGAALGGGLVLGSGMRLKLLLAGELAFLAGPDRPGHAAALASSSVLAAGCEEVLFRGVALAAVGVAAGASPGAAAWALALLAAVAFVARHHLPPAASARTGPRGLAIQAAAAGGLLALTVGSGSLYPAMLAHLVNNAPAAVLAVQRGRLGGRR
jgi:hypothetical protein